MGTRERQLERKGGELDLLVDYSNDEGREWGKELEVTSVRDRKSGKMGALCGEEKHHEVSPTADWVKLAPQGFLFPLEEGGNLARLVFQHPGAFACLSPFWSLKVQNKLPNKGAPRLAPFSYKDRAKILLF